MKTAFKLIVLFFFVFLVGCMVTKRKYTGGYYVHWKSEDYASKTAIKPLTAQPPINKIASINNSSTKNNANSKTENPRSQKLVEFAPVQSIRKIGIIGLQNNLLPKSFSTNYFVAPPDSIPEQSNAEKEASEKQKRLSNHFWWFGFLCSLVLFYITVFVGNELGGGGGNTASNDPELAAILFLIPITLFIISLFHCFKAMKGGHHLGLITIVVLDIIAIIIFTLLIISLFVTFL